LDVLKKKIGMVARQRLNLMEDHSVNAQCIVIESDIDEKTNQIAATVIVKRGTLRIEDAFVTGMNEGRVRFLVNDQGQQVK
jgi:translation initiation factor IF-2